MAARGKAGRHPDAAGAHRRLDRHGDGLSVAVAANAEEHWHVGIDIP
jgi:hypothetical protein